MGPRLGALFASLDDLNPTPTHLWGYLRALIGRQSGDACLDVNEVIQSEVQVLVDTVDVLAVDIRVFLGDFLNPSLGGSSALTSWRGSEHYRAICDTVLSARVPKMLIASGVDLHWEGPDNPLEGLLPHVDCLAWPYEQGVVARSAVPIQWVDQYSHQRACPHEAWLRVVGRPIPRLDLPHAVAHLELRTTPRHFFDASIPGVPYATRRLARQSAKSARLRVAPYSLPDRALQLEQRLLGPRFASRRHRILSNQLRAMNQRWMVRRSSTTYVDGSAYGYAVRKFFEIPAVGSALIALPFVGMQEYGFIDGVNFLSTVPERYGETARGLLRNPTKLASVQQAGSRLVAERHMSSQRAQSVVKSLELLAEGAFRGARFIDGKLTYL